MNTSVLLEHENTLALLTLNRPDVLNVLDLDMIEALVAHTSALSSDDSVRCVILRGAGKHFMAGGDIRRFAAELHRPAAERQKWFTEMVHGVHAAIEHTQRIRAPIIASVHGAIAGFGMSLVGAADLAIAADNAYFASAYRNIALTPDGGGTFTLPRLVGRKKAMEILLLSERFGAAEALRLGLVNRVVPPHELDTATRAMAQTILDGPPIALANAKRLLNQSATSTLSEQLNSEAMAFGACAATDDFVEGIASFLAKRTADFKGR